MYVHSFAKNPLFCLSFKVSVYMCWSAWLCCAHISEQRIAVAMTT
jgi:hypothetical protein